MLFTVLAMNYFSIWFIYECSSFELPENVLKVCVLQQQAVGYRQIDCGTIQ